MAPLLGGEKSGVTTERDCSSVTLKSPDGCTKSESAPNNKTGSRFDEALTKKKIRIADAFRALCPRHPKFDLSKYLTSTVGMELKINSVFRLPPAKCYLTNRAFVVFAPPHPLHTPTHTPFQSKLQCSICVNHYISGAIMDL